MNSPSAVVTEGRTTTTPAAPTTRPTSVHPAVLITATGVVAPVEGRSGAGWIVRTPCYATAVVSDVKPALPADVVLDPGHGGSEDGAVGPNGLAEKTVNLAVAQSAAGDLQAAGFSVLLTRSTDIDLTIATRAEIVTRLRPRAFVSLHHNSVPDGPLSRPGTAVFYQLASRDSKRLAGLIYEEVVRVLATYATSWVGDRDAGAKYRQGDHGDYYGILRSTAGIPAALAELSYISDPAEAALLARSDVQGAEGGAVARGIIRYLTSNDPGSGFTVPYPRTEPAGNGGTPASCVEPGL